MRSCRLSALASLLVRPLAGHAFLYITRRSGRTSTKGFSGLVADQVSSCSHATKLLPVGSLASVSARTSDSRLLTAQTLELLSQRGKVPALGISMQSSPPQQRTPSLLRFLDTMQ